MGNLRLAGHKFVVVLNLFMLSVLFYIELLPQMHHISESLHFIPREILLSQIMIYMTSSAYRITNSHILRLLTMTGRQVVTVLTHRTTTSLEPSFWQICCLCVSQSKRLGHFKIIIHFSLHNSSLSLPTGSPTHR